MFVKSVVLFVKYLVGHDQSALKDGRSTSGPEVGSCTMGFCTSEVRLVTYRGKKNVGFY